MHRNSNCWWVLCGLVYSSILLSGTAFSQESYSPYAEQSNPATVYWGDTHVHTKLSIDGYSAGNKLLGPEEAYRFAKGQPVTAHNGMNAQLHRPLDFIVVADHAANMGLLAGLEGADPILLSTISGKQLYAQWEAIQAIVDTKVRTQERWKFEGSLFPLLGTDRHETLEPIHFKSVWQQSTASAEKHNEPGKFTTFIGYEWTSMGATAASAAENSDFLSVVSNLHRVVLFKDGADKINQIVPFSILDSSDPADLWQFMDDYERSTGGEVLAIPHNGNISRGDMFSLMDFQGRPLTSNYAKTRSRWEPLYEVTQIKGDGEVHPLLSPTDEFADYETWDRPHYTTMQQKHSQYARSALKLGLNQQKKLGVNPFKFGMIGSTDSHTSLSTVDDDNFWGKQTLHEPSPERMLFKHINWNMSSSGYAAVWAQENTRESLFAAMKRKEVYASTGPRMTVRFFGGWDYEANDAWRPDMANIGYNKGVPMGGDLVNAPINQSPSFLIRAVKDPDGANLDRVQVIKGWRDHRGELHEKIYNVALSDHRKPDKKGTVKPVGTTVNVENASYINSIGDPELSVVWQDPDFNRSELAFYYVRVLEIPTPRWTAHDVKFFQLSGLPSEIPMVTQERAYTSPIWYSP